MRFAFINAQRVLTAHGCMEANGDDERLAVPEDFNLEPGRWREQEGEWLSYAAPTSVPQTVTMRQARLALLAAGKLTNVDQAIAALPSPEKDVAKIEWDYASHVDRTSPIVSLLGPALGLNEAALDALFIQASQL